MLTSSISRIATVLTTNDFAFQVCVTYYKIHTCSEILVAEPQRKPVHILPIIIIYILAQTLGRLTFAAKPISTALSINSHSCAMPFLHSKQA